MIPTLSSIFCDLSRISHAALVIRDLYSFCKLPHARQNFQRNGITSKIPTKHNKGCRVKKLNGWQRLWVVGTVALGICTIGFGVANLDTKSRLLDEHERRVDEYRSQISELKSRKHSNKPTSKMDKLMFGDDPDTRRNELTSDIITSNNQLETNLKTVNSNLFKKSLILFFFWLGVSIAAYLSGVVINWVYRGFRPKG